MDPTLFGYVFGKGGDTATEVRPEAETKAAAPASRTPERQRGASGASGGDGGDTDTATEVEAGAAGAAAGPEAAAAAAACTSEWPGVSAATVVLLEKQNWTVAKVRAVLRGNKHVLVTLFRARHIPDADIAAILRHAQRAQNGDDGDR